jgi:dTDP-4-amino-4,6-dideoxygalactose transaminase
MSQPITALSWSSLAEGTGFASLESIDCRGKPVSAIPPLDLTSQYREIGAEIDAAVLQVLGSGQYIGGKAVQTFEQSFADYIGTSEAIGCNSGTDALYLALRALDIGAGDEVIVPSFSFFATAEVVSMTGATPVFVDIDASGFLLNLDQVEAAIAPQTKAIIPVHLFGQPVDMQRLMAIARSHSLYVIEDCAQATGAEWAGKKVGSWGDFGCFSFFPTKNLGACGDGGAITTSHPEWASRLRYLREHGMPVRYYHEELGVNSRLDALQATILSIKLRHLDRWNQKRGAIAQQYAQLLTSIPGLVAPELPVGGVGVWNQYTIRVKPCSDPQRCLGQTCPGMELGACRDWVKAQLQAQGISSMIYYPVPIHLQKAYQSLDYQVGDLPLTEQASQEVLSLPMFPELSAEQQGRIAQALAELSQAFQAA